MLLANSEIPSVHSSDKELVDVGFRSEDAGSIVTSRAEEQQQFTSRNHTRGRRRGGRIDTMGRGISLHFKHRGG